MPLSPEFKESAKSALTNLVDLGTNTLVGLTNTAKQQIQGAPAPVPVTPAPAQNENLIFWLAAGAILFIALKKKR